jgi:4-amino-4-deoxy-L-arabinose transferase-like glycosyltransferase
MLLCITAAVMVSSVLQESQTWDEATHLAAGYSYWKTGNFQLNVEHPPLIKLLCALPLLALSPDIPLDGPGWREPDQVKFGREFLYYNRLPAETFLLAGRSMTILLTLLFGAAIALWMRAEFGTVAALIAVVLFVFDPNIIAHGRYVTTDLAVAGFFFLACLAWASWLERGGRWRLLAAGAGVALTITAKFSGLLLFPLMLLFVLWRWFRAGFAPRHIAGYAVVTAMALVMIAIVYAPATLHSLSGHSATMADGFEAKTWVGHAMVIAGRIGIPAHPYAWGVNTLSEHSSGGHRNYLLGKVSDRAHWYYFPVAIGVKSTTAALLFLAAAAIGARRYPYFAIAAMVYLIVAVVNGLNVGHRHVLPVYPLWYALAGIGASALAARWRPAAAVAAVLLAAHAAESLAAYPHYLPFFNVAAGGPKNGWRYLGDSNLDWGQDVKRLQAYLQSRQEREVCISYFGNAHVPYYGIWEKELPVAASEARKDIDCLAAVSVTELQGVYRTPDDYAWLREREPAARIGHSIYVYDLKKTRSQ